MECPHGMGHQTTNLGVRSLRARQDINKLLNIGASGEKPCPRCVRDRDGGSIPGGRGDGNSHRGTAAARSSRRAEFSVGSDNPIVFFPRIELTNAGLKHASLLHGTEGLQLSLTAILFGELLTPSFRSFAGTSDLSVSAEL